MKQKLPLPYLLIACIATSGCASGPRYKPAPSAKIKHVYKREQIVSSAGKQVGGAVISGIVGGLLGPIGILVTAIGGNKTQKMTMENYWKSFSNTEMVGVITEDVTKRRLSQYKSNPKWFKNLSHQKDIPTHFSVDFGSGNLLFLPTDKGVTPQVGDVVNVYAPPNAWTLVNQHADFNATPLITGIRCKASDIVCVNSQHNEPGILKHLGQPSEE